MTVGIIGAGLTGLTLGSLIADCEIVEKNSECGGLCQSLEEDGFTFDWGGSHIIFSKDKEVQCNSSSAGQRCSMRVKRINSGYLFCFCI